MAVDCEVSVIIPTFRAGKDLLQCLESIAKDVDAPAHEVLVVFNSPVPPPAGLDLTEYHPTARIVEAGSNLGFAAGCNLGASEAVGRTLAFINDDMTVRAGWMKSLVKPILDGECAATGGMILSSDGKKIDFDGSSINLLGWGFQAGHGDRLLDDGFVTHQDLPFACGGNFAIKTDIFEHASRAGVAEPCGFDRDYFAFYEDVDLGWRLMLMGYAIEYVHDAVVLHAGGATGSLIESPLKWFLQERNALQTIIKNYSDDLFREILPIALAMVGVRSQILSVVDVYEIATDRVWRDLILSDLGSIKHEHLSGLDEIMHNVRDLGKSVKSGMRKTSGWLAHESRAQAGLLALEWCLDNWDELMEKRARVQELRVKSDREILPLFGDPLRPVLGHPREVEAMKPLEKILNEFMK